MCGRYALILAPRDVRRRMRLDGLPAESEDEDNGDLGDVEDQDDDGSDRRRAHTGSGHDSRAETDGESSTKGQKEEPGKISTKGVRPSYNIAPGYIESVYRAMIVDEQGKEVMGKEKDRRLSEIAKAGQDGEGQEEGKEMKEGGVKLKYVLQGMKWGLVPSWTKNQPDYKSQLKTINCRSDNLLSHPSTLWSPLVKHRKRCVIPAEGFFEWKTLANGKDKIPYYIKRKDGGLMYFAGLYDYVPTTGLWSYTILTTDSCSEMGSLHDRMPVILQPAEARRWVDPRLGGGETGLEELKGLLRPFGGGVEVYQVNREVGKAGRSDKSFVEPVDEGGIKKFFGGGAGGKGVKQEKKDAMGKSQADKSEKNVPKVKHEEHKMKTKQQVEDENKEDNAPMPDLDEFSISTPKLKRSHPPDVGRKRDLTGDGTPPPKQAKREAHPTQRTPTKKPQAKRNPKTAGGKQEGSQKITSFFKK